MKILFIHATAGAGHKMAAEALFSYLKQQGGHSPHIIDILDYTNPLFKKLYRGTYGWLISKFPQLWGFMFGFLDIPAVYPLMKFGRRIYNYLNTGPLRKFLIDENFDYIFSTHFMANEVVSALKKKDKVQSILITTVTDYDVHRIWLGDRVDQYCVASDWTKKKLTSMGIDEKTIHVTGIPTHHKFTDPKNISEIQEKLGLDKEKFTVLIATGSFGIGPIEEISNKLKGFQVLVICGHNKNLYESLSPQATADKKIYPLVNNMHELMAVSHVMVTKPGGLSISEALVSDLPLVFFNSIPGQETNNVKVLKEYGIGISGLSVDEIVDQLNVYKSSKETFSAAVAKSKNLAKPQAAQSILSLIDG